MRTLTYDIPEGKKINNVKFATKLVSKACDYSNEEILIKTDDNNFVDLKSIMGVLTLHYSTAKHIVINIKGTYEDECAEDLRKYIQQIL